jgi:hypothetical protein
MAQSLVVIRRVPEGYIVSVEPPLPDGEDRRRTLHDKVGAWSLAQAWWTEHKLGLRDETVNNVKITRAPRGPYKKRSFY